MGNHFGSVGFENRSRGRAAGALPQSSLEYGMARSRNILGEGDIDN